MSPRQPSLALTSRLGAALFGVAALVLGGAIGCPTAPAFVDDDDEPDKARPLPFDIEVVESLDVRRGDVVDWKSMTALESGNAAVTIMVGDPFAGVQPIAGTAAIYATTGPPALDEVTIVPGTHQYELEWAATEGATYLFQIEATEGTAPYRVVFELEPVPDDPCEVLVCEDNEECVDGECVEVRPADPTICEPECGRLEICVDNVCEPVCGGPCPRGQYCHRASNECRRDPCFQKKCPSGTRCVWGRCRTIEREEPSPSDPKASTDKPAPAKTSLSARIIQIIDTGASVTLVLNKGTTHGVAAGMTGTVPGVGTFTIRDAFAFRSRAEIKGKTGKDVGTTRAATIRLR